MTLPKLLIPVTVVLTSLAFAASDDNPIKKAMACAHKAPQGEKKLCEKIVGGTATDAEVNAALAAYKAAADCKPPKGDAAAFKDKWAKLIAATEDVAAKKPGAADAYKAAANCKACHTDFKPSDKK